jgi:hypothetical protein
VCALRRRHRRAVDGVSTTEEDTVMTQAFHGVRYQVSDVSRGGRQIELEDPDGSSAERFEPAK